MNKYEKRITAEKNHNELGHLRRNPTTEEIHTILRGLGLDGQTLSRQEEIFGNAMLSEEEIASMVS